MKIALLAFIGLAAGLLGGVAGTYIRASGSAPELSSSVPDAGAARLEQIQEALERIEQRLHRLEVAPPMSNGPAAGAIVESAALPADDFAAAASPDSPLDEDLKVKILDVVQEREQSEREARSRMRSEYQAARQTELMNRLDELGLNSYQEEQLSAILKKRREAMEKFRQRMFSGEEGIDRAAVRDEMHTVRGETDREVEELLTTDQYAAFQEMDSGGRGPGRGGGGFGR